MNYAIDYEHIYGSEYILCFTISLSLTFNPLLKIQS